MASEQNSQQKSEVSGTQETGEMLFGNVPITITGGSVQIDFADERGVDEFVDNGSGGNKKKLKHPKEPHLTRIEITEDRETGAMLYQTINLKDLRIAGDCRIKIFYE